MDSAVIAAVISALVALMVAYMSRKQKAAEADKTASEAWAGLVEPMRQRISELETDYAEARKELQKLEAVMRNMQSTITAQNETIKRQDAAIRLLNAHVTALGGEPLDFHNGKA